MALLLAVVSILSAHAQAHADYLAASGALHHSDLTPLTAVCEWAGETIYRGNDPDGRWDDYQASPPHAQTVNYPWTHHGEGRAQMADDRWVVVDVFCVAGTTTAPTTTNPPTTAPPATTSSLREDVPLVEPKYVPLGSPPPFCDLVNPTPCVL